MKFFSLIFILLTSIFQHAAELKGTDIHNDVTYFNTSQNVKTLLTSYQNYEPEQESSSSISFLFNDISNHSINFVEFKEYEELNHHSVPFRNSACLHAKDPIFSQSYKTSNSFFVSYSKNHYLSFPASKQVLYQVFII